MKIRAGIGLGDEDDITVKGLNIVKRCSRVYLEIYTSMLTAGQTKLEEFYGRKLILADRELVEQGSDEILRGAKEEDIALLVVGDPFGATTHTDLILRARQESIPYEIVHNASIITGVGCSGLQLYSFGLLLGEIISIPFWTGTWKPDSFYDRIISNRSRGLHTLCLLDIKVKEPTLDSLMKKEREYLPPSFMTVNVASSQLLAILDIKKNSSEGIPQHSYNSTTKCVGLARVGSQSQKIVFCSLKHMETVNIGDPLHCLIIPGTIQPLEEEYLSLTWEGGSIFPVFRPEKARNYQKQLLISYSAADLRNIFKLKY